MHTKHDVITFLVENNEDILYQISEYVNQQLEASNDDLDDIVLAALTDIVQEHFDINYIDITEILEEDEIKKDPFYSLYFREELYVTNTNTLH